MRIDRKKLIVEVDIKHIKNL